MLFVGFRGSNTPVVQSCFQLPDHSPFPFLKGISWWSPFVWRYITVHKELRFFLYQRVLPKWFSKISFARGAMGFHQLLWRTKRSQVEEKWALTIPELLEASFTKPPVGCKQAWNRPTHRACCQQASCEPGPQQWRSFEVWALISMFGKPGASNRRGLIIHEKRVKNGWIIMLSKKIYGLLSFINQDNSIFSLKRVSNIRIWNFFDPSFRVAGLSNLSETQEEGASIRECHKHIALFVILMA